MLKNLLNRLQNVSPLYNAVVRQSRLPVFYSGLGVADTVWGRLDMLYLHVFVALSGLSDSDPADGRYIDAFFQNMFKRDIDNALREMGVGDLSVGRKVKKMAEDYHGRATAYRSALASDDFSELPPVITRNLLAHIEDAELARSYAEALAGYMRQSMQIISGLDRATLLSGNIPWPVVMLAEDTSLAVQPLQIPAE